MRYFIFTWIAVMLPLVGCSLNVHKTSDVNVTAELNAETVETPAPAPVEAPVPTEKKWVTGVHVDICKLPKFPHKLKTDSTVFDPAIESCNAGNSAIMEIGNGHVDPNATSLYLEWNDPDVDDSDVDNPELNIDYVQARHGQSFNDYINENIPKTNYIDYQIHKDQEMSDRFGVEVSKVTCREEEVEEEGALETHVEGYFFAYEGNYGGILFRSKGTEFDEAKKVIISDMKLVIKTEAEMDKDREEYRRKLAEKKIKEEEKLIREYGGIAKLSLKNPEVVGNLDKRIIQKVVRQHANELRACCYESQLGKIKIEKGTLVINWVISPQGAVKEVSVKESPFGHEKLEGCFTKSIKDWRFPAPKGGGNVDVTYPFGIEIQKEVSQNLLRDLRAPSE